MAVTLVTLVASDETLSAAEERANVRARDLAKRPGVTIDDAARLKLLHHEIGKAAVNGWLKRLRHPDFRWLTKSNRIDFLINGLGVAVRVIPCFVPVESWYEIVVPAQAIQRTRAQDYYLFLSYQESERRVTVLGAMSHHRLLHEAKQIFSATEDQEDQQTPTGYRVTVSELSPPSLFLFESQVRKIFSATEG